MRFELETRFRQIQSRLKGDSEETNEVPVHGQEKKKAKIIANHSTLPQCSKALEEHVGRTVQPAGEHRRH